MNNYQLYRTNPLLSGQIKWNLTVKSTGAQLEVDDFHLSPINKNIAINYSNYSSNFLDNDHIFNIKKFYSAYKTEFYNCSGNKKLPTRPIIDNVQNRITSDQFDTTYNMGVSRISHKIYGKQFAVFCPMWIENVRENIVFKIECYSGDKMVTYKTLKLDVNGNNQNVGEYHSKFQKYLKDYLTSIGISGPNSDNGDEVMTIDFNSKKCTMNVVKVNGSGQQGITNDEFVHELLFREIPLMFFDYKIISLFKTHESISRQLYNFNILFNIEDLLNEWEMSIFKDKLPQFNIKIKTEIDEKPIEIVDFYTNYDFIPKINYEGSRENVLDYLQDDKCIDLIDKNKIIPTICHWSLSDNDNYIFNAYDGFSMSGTSRNYNGAPNLLAREYTKGLNNFYWWTNNNYSPLQFIQKYQCEHFVDHYEEYLDKMTEFGNNVWVNNIKYKTPYQYTHMKMCISQLEEIPTDLSGWDQLSDNIWYKTNLKNFEDGWKIVDNESDIYFIFIYSLTSENEISTKSQLTFNSLIKKVPAFKEYFRGFDMTKNPPLIYIDESVAIQPAKGPVMVDNILGGKTTKEIVYYKFNDLMRKYLYRYSGRIRPTFIHGNGRYQNYLYYIQKMTTYEYVHSLYNDSTNKFPPTYPSIDFCPIKRLTYDEKLTENLYESAGRDIKLKDEESWFNISNMYYLPTKMEWQIIYDQSEGKKEIKDIVKDGFKSWYKEKFGITGRELTKAELEKIYYIMSLYDYESSFDYVDDKSISNYKYDIKLTLK